MSSSFGLCAFGLPKKSLCLPLCPKKPVLENYEYITKPKATSTENDFSEIRNRKKEILKNQTILKQSVDLNMMENGKEQ